MSLTVDRPSGDVVVLGAVSRGLVGPVAGSRDLDAALDTARAAEAAGASTVVIPLPASPAASARPYWPATAQALAVLLATTRVRVVLEVAAGADRVALARFATSAAALAPDRLVVAVVGEGAAPAAQRLQRRWAGPVVVGPVTVSSPMAPVA